ncbi:response regulator [bacterium]|nr:response regulator [bacterium]
MQPEIGDSEGKKDDTGSRLFRRFTSALRQWIRAVLPVAEKTDDGPTRFADPSQAPSDKQIEKALITAIWENAIDLPESISMGPQPIHSRFSLPVLLSTIESLYSPIAEEKGLGFSFNLGQEINGFFIGDPNRIDRILRILLDNAIICTHEGEITVTCLFRDNHFTVSISDTGIGISKEKMPALFQQPDGNEAGLSDAPISMAGKGLVIAKMLCDSQGGQITVKSEPFVGTVITVSLPLQKVNTAMDNPSPGESMIRRWRVKYGENPDLETIFLRGLACLRDEIEEVADMISKDRRHELAGMLHSMKSFPGGFGLTEVYDIIKALERSARLQPYDRSQLEAHLAELRQILASIPETPFPQKTREENYRAVLSADMPGNPMVLVADDDRMNREMIAYLLRKIGLGFRIVNNGKEVLKELEQTRFDLLLLDIRMPVMGGVETVKRIRGDRNLENLTIIAMTANDLPGDEQRYKEIGCNDVITKPIDIKELTVKIDAALA